jgi:hypothetical protein
MAVGRKWAAGDWASIRGAPAEGPGAAAARCNMKAGRGPYTTAAATHQPMQHGQCSRACSWMAAMDVWQLNQGPGRAMPPPKRSTLSSPHAPVARVVAAHVGGSGGGGGGVSLAVAVAVAGWGCGRQGKVQANEGRWCICLMNAPGTQQASKVVGQRSTTVARRDTHHAQAGFNHYARWSRKWSRTCATRKQAALGPCPNLEPPEDIKETPHGILSLLGAPSFIKLCCLASKVATLILVCGGLGTGGWWLSAVPPLPPQASGRPGREVLDRTRMQDGTLCGDTECSERQVTGDSIF